MPFNRTQRSWVYRAAKDLDNTVAFGSTKDLRSRGAVLFVNFAISKPAVQALSNGAREAGIWLNTGEGGVSRYHLEGACDIVVQIGTAKYGVGAAPSATHYPELIGWKDTFNLPPLATAKVIGQFTDFTGIYMMHCHNLEHEDYAMMMNFEVVP